VVERDQAIPVPVQHACGVLQALLLAPLRELQLEALGFLARLGVGDGAQHQGGLRPLLLGHLVQHVHQPVIPAPLLTGPRVDVSQGAPGPQLSRSPCHFSFSRPIVVDDNGASLPRRPRSARSKSPCASPCRYNCGKSSVTSFVWRLNNGSTRLSKRPSRPRTRGRRTAIVPG